MNSIILLVVGLSAVLPSALSDSCTCGRENLNTRIIHGQEAQRDRYPWLVSLLTKVNGNSYSSCGASIINDRYVLTAAHCLASNPRPSDVIAMVGAHTDDERMQAGSGQMQLDVESIKIHENYDHDGDKMDDDIALIKLATPVTFDDKFNPVCLPAFSEHDNLFVYGWGRQNVGRTRRLTSSKVLHEVEVDEVDNSTCIAKYWGHKYLPEKEICAGTTSGSCQGDSGGPLSTRSSDGHVYQVGVVSFGTPGCGVEGQMKPDIYERVTAHMNWIQRNTKGAKWCPGPQSPAFTKKNIAKSGKSFKSGGQGAGAKAGPSGSRGGRPSGPSGPSGPRRPSGPSGFPGLDGIDFSKLPSGSGAVRVIRYPDGTTKVERVGNADFKLPADFESSFGSGFGSSFGRGLFN